MIRVLLVDQDADARAVVRMILPRDFAVIQCTRGRRGLDLIASEDPDLVLLCSKLPDMSGLDVLRCIRRYPAPPPVIMISEENAARAAVSAMKMGAEDYVLKPAELSRLLSAARELAGRRAVASDRTADHPALAALVGNSAAVRRTRRHIALFAPTKMPVLVTGESGTGKELVARLLHDVSQRRRGPFIALNCGAIPDGLVETELFGSVRGAFTGAVSRPGGFERASGGTLFLDEVGEMSLKAQVKLLRVLEEQAVTRVGGTEPVGTDVRVVAATNARLEKAVNEGRFRTDLYYRINGLEIRLDPLRNRKEDIGSLAAHFLKNPRTTCAAEAAPRYRLAAGTVEKLESHTWPGNVRELRSVVEVGALFSNGCVEPGHIRFAEGVEG